MSTATNQQDLIGAQVAQSPSGTGPLALKQLSATSTGIEHKLIGDYTFSGYTTTAVLRLRHNDSVNGASAIIFDGPNTDDEYGAIGVGGSAGIYDCLFLESSDEQHQSSGKPFRYIQRSTLTGTKAYASVIRFECAITAGGPMKFNNSTGTQILGIQDGQVTVGTGALSTGQLFVPADSGYNTGGVVLLNASGVYGAHLFVGGDNNTYLRVSSSAGFTLVDTTGAVLPASITNAGGFQGSGIKVGGNNGASGTNIDLIVSATATLDFPSTIATAVSDLTITVTGASTGDVVLLGVPNGSVTTTASYWAWVSSADTVTVRFSPKGVEDPASGTFRATVISH